MAKVSCQSSWLLMSSIRQVVRGCSRRVAAGWSFSDGMEAPDSDPEGLSFIFGRPRRITDLAVKGNGEERKKKRRRSKGFTFLSFFSLPAKASFLMAKTFFFRCLLLGHLAKTGFFRCLLFSLFGQEFQARCLSQQVSLVRHLEIAESEELRRKKGFQKKRKKEKKDFKKKGRKKERKKKKNEDAAIPQR